LTNPRGRGRLKATQRAAGWTIEGWLPGWTPLSTPLDFLFQGEVYDEKEVFWTGPHWDYIPHTVHGTRCGPRHPVGPQCLIPECFGVDNGILPQKTKSVKP